MPAILYTRQYLSKTHSEYNPRGILLIPHSQNASEEFVFLFFKTLFQYRSCIYVTKIPVGAVFSSVPVGSLEELDQDLYPDQLQNVSWDSLAFWSVSHLLTISRGGF